MPSKILLLSGPIAAGKSTLCRMLSESYGIKVIKTWECLRVLSQDTVPLSRQALQKYGESLDNETKGTWLVRPVEMYCERYEDPNAIVVIDSIRLKGQADAIRQRYGSNRCIHIHLHAPTRVLDERYRNRKDKHIKEMTSYAETQANKTERNVSRLIQYADIVIDTNRCDKQDVLVKVLAYLNVGGKGYDRIVDVLVGGQYGSEGKGHIANYLSREYGYLLRTGGPNAGHKVFEEGRPFTFHSLPSGTRSSSAKIVIGPGALLFPPQFIEEVEKCGLDPSRLFIDPQATIINDADRRRETRGVRPRIASTGQGVGEALARRIRDRGKRHKMAKDVRELAHFIKPTHEVLETAYVKGERILVEGTQGTGLSIFHGHYPHVTSRDTTVAGCLAEAGISPSRVRKVIMVCRTYPIRVQNSVAKKTSGAMKQEISLDQISERSQIDLQELKKTERTSTTNRRRRIAEFDWELLRRAASLNAPTDIALTFLDYLSIENRKARRFDMLTSESIQFVDAVERVARAPVSLLSTRFHHRSIIDRRSW